MSFNCSDPFETASETEGKLASSGWACGATMTMNLREEYLLPTAVSPPHQMFMTTEASLNYLTDLATVSTLIGDPDCSIGNDPDPYEPPFFPDYYYKVTFQEFHSDHLFLCKMKISQKPDGFKFCLTTAQIYHVW